MSLKVASSVCLALLLAQSAWAQVRRGTALAFWLWQNELAIAADSREVFREGEYDDSKCKISAFGPQFVFTATGTVGAVSTLQTEAWDAHTIARNVWAKEVTADVDPVDLITRVSDEWIRATEPYYGLPTTVRDAREHAKREPKLATALFAATNHSGKIAVAVVVMRYDLDLFDLSGQIQILHERKFLKNPAYAWLGTEDAVKTMDEFGNRTSQRAKAYMEWFTSRISSFEQSRQRAEVISKLVELSILLDGPNGPNPDVAFPVDVIQLKGGKAQWLWVKPNCRRD